MKALRHFAILLFALLLVTSVALAQEQPATTTETSAATTTTADTTTATDTTTTTTTETTQPEADDEEPADSRIISAAGPRKNGNVHLGDEVQVGVSGFEALRKAAAERQKPITLWLNGLDTKLERIGEAPVPKQADAHTLTFRLSRTDDNKDLWRTLLHDPFGEPREKLTLSVGVSEDKPLLFAEGVDGRLTLQKTRFTAASVFWALVVLLIIVLLLRYASEMLRAGPPIDGQKLTYSLARSQMAWWFILIIASYIMIWLITGDRDTITTSLLVLMGISAATAMGSVAIDANADSRVNDKRKELEAEKESLQGSSINVAMQAESPAPQTQAANNAIGQRMNEIDQTIANLTKPAYSTGSWLRDVLSDNSGTIGLHRFQILAWTAVLGFIFLASVFSDLSMPEFNSTLLTLMGISAGTYLGFKLPSNGG